MKKHNISPAKSSAYEPPQHSATPPSNLGSCRVPLPHLIHFIIAFVIVYFRNIDADRRAKLYCLLILIMFPSSFVYEFVSKNKNKFKEIRSIDNNDHWIIGVPTNKQH